MKKMIKKILSFPICLTLLAVLLLAGVFASPVRAADLASSVRSAAAAIPVVTPDKGDLDEITDYEITIDVNDDGTLSMVYHIDWKVLDSDSEGPLSWVNIGIPNQHYISYKALSDTISKISYSSSGGTNLKITFDRDYFGGHRGLDALPGPFAEDVREDRALW